MTNAIILVLMNKLILTINTVLIKMYLVKDVTIQVFITTSMVYA